MIVNRPTGTRRKGVVLVGLPSVISDARTELYIALRASGLRKADLARRMGIHRQQVDRGFDIEHASRIEQLEAAFAALQMKLTVDIQPVTDLAA